MKTKIMATALAMAAVLAQKSAEAAETCYYNPNGSGTWADASRWYEGKVPQSGDLAYVSNGVMRVTSADLDVASLVGGMYPVNYTDAVEFDLDEDFHFTKRIIGKGKIVKKGGGALYLDVYYATLADAFEAAQANETIELLADTTAAGIETDKAVTLDLAGHTVSSQ